MLSLSKHPRESALLPAQLPMLGKVKYLARSGILLQQPQPPCNFLIGFFLTAQIAAKAVLVELFASGHIPQAATIGADFIGENNAAVFAFPHPAKLQFEINQTDVDPGEHAAHEIIHPDSHRGNVLHLFIGRPAEAGDVFLGDQGITQRIILVIILDQCVRQRLTLFDAQPLADRTGSNVADHHFDGNDLNLPNQLLAHVQAADEMGGDANMRKAGEHMFTDAIVDNTLAVDRALFLSIEGGGIILEILDDRARFGAFIEDFGLAFVDLAATGHAAFLEVYRGNEKTSPGKASRSATARAGAFLTYRRKRQNCNCSGARLAAAVFGITNSPMRLFQLILLALLMAASPAIAQQASPLERQVMQSLSAAPKGTRIGLLVVDSDGKDVVAVRADDRFIPASNTKLFTTAAAMEFAPQLAMAAGTNRIDMARAGSRMRIEPHGKGPPDVVLIGLGSPDMSSAADCAGDNCLTTFARIIAARHRKLGNIIGDDSWFPDQRWSPGMSWNNIGTASGTAISALSLDNNELPVTVTPTGPGQAPIVEILPYYAVRNEAVTIASGKTTLAFERAPNGQILRLYGEIAADGPPFKERLGIDDPAHYAAWMLRRMLEGQGVRLRGTIQVRHRPPAQIDDPQLRGGHPVPGVFPADAVAAASGMALADDVAIINKVSQNLHAELLLRRIGRIEGSGSLADGLAATTNLFIRAGIPRAGFDFSDGSGMSSYNRVSPRATVALLRWAAGRPWGAAWRASLPVGGSDGTLKRRFADTPLAARVFAKTGTLNATSALSGYLIAASGRELTFSIFANDVPDGANAIPAMDSALQLIAAAN